MRSHTQPYDSAKKHGIHYTPSELASYLANHTLSYLPHKTKSIVLDPACGDGELLDAIVQSADPDRRRTLSLLGIDRDQTACENTHLRLSNLDTEYHVLQADFLELSTPRTAIQTDMFGANTIPTRSIDKVDAIITNPPYVRTQVLGASVAQKLASKYGLTGRIDLYHAFVGAMTEHLVPGGILGLLCSNRFLTTMGGASLRRILAENFELLEIVDLGDTRLFAAAVLPAIVIARKKLQANQSDCRFTRIYEIHQPEDLPATAYPSVVTALRDNAEGLIMTEASTWRIERGTLNLGEGAKATWALTSPDLAIWLKVCAEHTERTFGDIGPIRVGIKSNADKIFIRQDWELLEESVQPEDALLRPIITHHIAKKWTVDPSSHNRKVLYPHTMLNGRRVTVDLEHFPKAKTYFGQHYEELNRREYLSKGNRKWYEIWVAQNPAEWSRSKIIFPDISESPKFALDTSGAIVNGDCYWLLVDGIVSPEYISVMLAVANSSFAEAFYDAVCGNRLYAGRRRYITQYVEKFPIPKLTSEQQVDIHRCVEELRQIDPADPTVKARETRLNDIIWSAFGVTKEV